MGTAFNDLDRAIEWVLDVEDISRIYTGSGWG